MQFSKIQQIFPCQYSRYEKLKEAAYGYSAIVGLAFNEKTNTLYQISPCDATLYAHDYDPRTGALCKFWPLRNCMLKYDERRFAFGWRCEFVFLLQLASALFINSNWTQTFSRMGWRSINGATSVPVYTAVEPFSCSVLCKHSDRFKCLKQIVLEELLCKSFRLWPFAGLDGWLIKFRCQHHFR